MSNYLCETCLILTDDGHQCSPDINTHGIQLKGANGISTSSSTNVITVTTNAPYIEQKSFTPTISGSILAGVGTYSTQAGYYSSIGNMIFISGNITWTAHTGTGSMLITGVPFPCRNSANFDPEMVFNPININLPGSVVGLVAEMQPGTSHITLNGTKSNGTSVAIDMQSTGTIHFTGWYLK